MRCLLIDDEAPARHELRQLLGVHADVEIVGEAPGVAAALALVAAHRPDLVFLDIGLRGESGFDFVARLPEDHGLRIVFVTAYDRHAVRAFECNALDYLLKPVFADRLAETLRRVRARETPGPRVAGEDDAVLVKAGPVSRLVPWREIQSIAANGNYTRLRLADGDDLVVLRTLREWLELAPPGVFLQIHRSFLVRRTAIRELRPVGEKKHEILLRGNIVAPVGRGFAAGVRSALAGA